MKRAQNKRGGGAVVEYNGKRGKVFRIKYYDAAGTQVMETVGAESDGFTRKKAEAELRERLVRVERKGYRRPQQWTFALYANTWLTEGERRRGWKPGTVWKYRSTIRHLAQAFGSMPLGSIRPRDVAAYTTDALESFAPKTVQLHLNVLHGILATALREELIDTNPVTGAERPKVRRRKWRILQPVEVGRVLRAFTDEQARVMFLTLVLTGLRRFELLQLRWRDVDLVDGVLRVEESKTEEGERSIALSPALVSMLLAQLERSAFKGAGEFVFCHPDRGSMVDHEWYAVEFRKALETVGITDYVRPFHDLRHTSLTNGAAGGETPIALMGRAGHRSMDTTQQYIDLAGVVFRDEAAALEQRFFGGNFLPTFYPTEMTSPDPASPEPSDRADADPS